MPRSLDGGLIIQKASCDACSKITSSFEMRCIRQNFGMHLVRENYKTDHPGERPDVLPLLVQENGELVKKMLPPTEHPGLLVLPVFSECPRLVSNAPFTGMPKAIYFKQFTDAKTFKGGPFAHEVRFEMSTFYKLLAKIAHGLALATLGWRFKPMLPRLILQERVDDIGSYLIGRPFTEPAFGKPGNQHHLSLGNLMFWERKFIVAHIQLFADIWDEATNQGTPIYTVIVGEETVPFREALELAQHEHRSPNRR